MDTVLRAAVREIEAHAAEAGWDQPARLFALVPTADLLAREPALAAAMGLDAADGRGVADPGRAGRRCPVDQPLETVLAQIMWPAEVFGCAAVVERLVLPPSADAAAAGRPRRRRASSPRSTPTARRCGSSPPRRGTGRRTARCG